MTPEQVDRLEKLSEAIKFKHPLQKAELKEFVELIRLRRQTFGRELGSEGKNKTPRKRATGAPQASLADLMKEIGELPG